MRIESYKSFYRTIHVSREDTVYLENYVIINTEVEGELMTYSFNTITKLHGSHNSNAKQLREYKHKFDENKDWRI